jgi:hypothetical protein
MCVISRGTQQDKEKGRKKEKKTQMKNGNKRLITTPHQKHHVVAMDYIVALI